MAGPPAGPTKMMTGNDPVFVLCTGRSGSTLLRFLLDAHPELACPPETRIPWLCKQLAGAWAVVEDAPPSDGADGQEPVIAEPVAAGLRRSLEPVMAAYLDRTGKRRFCDKSLGAAKHAGLISQVWPDSRFICLYRHPMDVISSGLEASPWGLTGYGFNSYVSSPPDNNVAALARYWLGQTTAILAAEERFEDRCLPLRYEDLVTDPEGEMARLFKFIHVDPAPGIAAAGLGGRQQLFGPADYKIWATSKISAESVGRGWSLPVRLIPDQLLTRVNEMAGLLGYVPVDADWGTGARPAGFVAHAISGPAQSNDGTPPPWAQALGERLIAGLARRIQRGRPADKSLLLYVSAPTRGDSDAWWRVDLATGTVHGGVGARTADTDWSVTGSATGWKRILEDQANLGVAFRRGDLRYADKGDAGPGSRGAGERAMLLADILGLIDPYTSPQG
jgi:Sulfotransferase family